MNRLTLKISLIATYLFITGCMPVVIAVPTPVPGSGRTAGNTEPSPPEHAKHKDHKHKNHSSFKVPPGHLPPPGSCRIWYPGTPPGHQPPPGDCAQLSRRVPVGAYLISRSQRDPERLRVRVFENGVEIAIRLYQASTGNFISEEHL